MGNPHRQRLTQPPHTIMTPRETLRLLATSLLLTLVAPLQAGLNKLLPDQLYDAQGKAIPRENLDGKIIGVYVLSLIHISEPTRPY